MLAALGKTPLTDLTIGDESAPRANTVGLTLCRLWLAEANPIAEGIGHRHDGAVFLRLHTGLQIRVLFLRQFFLKCPHPSHGDVSIRPWACVAMMSAQMKDQPRA
jgi:hypothetical protein